VFAGFPPQAIAFYEGLEADNSKSYWEAHRDTYEECVRDPMEELILALNGEFGAGKVFRPYRDVRFSKDKSPYKTRCAALLKPDGSQLMGYYVDIGASGMYVGAGVYHFDTSALARVRRAIDADEAGGALQEIAKKLDKQGMPLHPPELKTAPRGYPRDHPRIDLLRRKRFAAMRLLAPGPWLHTRNALDRVRTEWRRARPLHDWLEAYGA
jgi:uncharacterized protein (TIGR02453 family)